MQGFDNRLVSYEHIHSISPGDFEKLLDAINPQTGELILDAMCGYGAVGKAIMQKVLQANVYFLDESGVQIERAKKNVPQANPNNFIVDSLPHSNFQDEYFDNIVIKMGLHEVLLSEHLKILKEFHRILKNTGKLIVWDIMLNNNTQKLFQDIIRKKDQLAGFNLLTTERYFFREDEFKINALEAGFKNINEFHTISYRFSSKKRLASELNNNINKLIELNNFIRGTFNDTLKSTLEYEDLGDDIQFSITKKIFILQK